MFATEDRAYTAFIVRRGWASPLVEVASRWERAMQISLSEEDAAILQQVLDAKLTDLRREISHTDSPRFRDTLYQVDAMLERLLPQLSSKQPAAGSR